MTPSLTTKPRLRRVRPRNKARIDAMIAESGLDTVAMESPTEADEDDGDDEEDEPEPEVKTKAARTSKGRGNLSAVP